MITVPIGVADLLEYLLERTTNRSDRGSSIHQPSNLTTPCDGFRLLMVSGISRENSAHGKHWNGALSKQRKRDHGLESQPFSFHPVNLFCRLHKEKDMGGKPTLSEQVNLCKHLWIWSPPFKKRNKNSDLFGGPLKCLQKCTIGCSGEMHHQLHMGKFAPGAPLQVEGGRSAQGNVPTCHKLIVNPALCLKQSTKCHSLLPGSLTAHPALWTEK